MCSKNFPKGGKVHRNSAKIFRQLFYIASGSFVVALYGIYGIANGGEGHLESCQCLQDSLKKILKGVEH